MPPFREHIFFKLLSVPEQPALGEIRVPKQLHHIILGTLGCPSWPLTASPEGHRSTEILCDRLCLLEEDLHYICQSCPNVLNNLVTSNTLPGT